MLIRTANTNDVTTIRNLALAIWPSTYASILSPEQLNYMLEQIYNEASLLKQMENNTFLIVENNKPCGFASYGPLENKIYKLHKLYVLLAEQGKGTGKALIEFIINDIKSKNARALRLNVNRYNNARSFYERLNFKIINTEDIDIGNGFFMNDYVMEKEI
jgi:GNAT superfamily N-acetyltransferase